jgi:HPt (histidine-containing phosphotransfer) domain-containing protein
MSDEDKLKQQMAQIGVRYLTRTLGEMQRMHEVLHSAVNGSPAMMKDLERLAHKIHGSGAMFGFDGLSDNAGEIEHIAGVLGNGEGPEQYKSMSESELHQRLHSAVAKLDAATRQAATERGIDLNGA